MVSRICCCYPVVFAYSPAGWAFPETILYAEVVVLLERRIQTRTSITNVAPNRRAVTPCWPEIPM